MAHASAFPEWPMADATGVVFSSCGCVAHLFACKVDDDFVLSPSLFQLSIEPQIFFFQGCVWHPFSRRGHPVGRNGEWMSPWNP